MIKKTLFLVFIIIAAINNFFAQKANYEELFYLLSILEDKNNLTTPTFKKNIIIKSDTVATFYGYTSGFIVLSNYKCFYPVKAFSDKPINTNSDEFNIFISILETDYQKQIKQNKELPENTTKNTIAWEKWMANSSELISDTIGPLLSSLYGQVNCRDNNNNLVNVTNYYTPNNYAVGCVALTFFTTMRFYEWPIHGVGSHNYTDEYGSTTGSHSADFENTTYRWDLILDEYNGVASNEENREALGKLAYQTAVAVDMDFENGGSTSNINRIPAAALNYFRYDRPTYIPETDIAFRDMIDQTLLGGDPVQLAVYTSSGAGHAIVCDGIIDATNPEDKFYHLNMGWWGSSNAWYHIQSDFNAGGYSIVDGAVLKMTPIPELSEVLYDVETNQATLTWMYSEKIENPVFELQQKINTDDWETINNQLTDFEYKYTPDINSTYKFRIKTTDNQSWSEEISFDPGSEAGKLSEIIFYPTLVKEKVYIQHNNLQNADFYIFSSSGQIVYYENFGDYTNTKKEIDVTFLPSAMYIAKIYTTEKNQSFKFIFQGNEQ